MSNLWLINFMCFKFFECLSLRHLELCCCCCLTTSPLDVGPFFSRKSVLIKMVSKFDAIENIFYPVDVY